MRQSNTRDRAHVVSATVIIVAAAALSFAARADVYVSRDANGRLVYSDRKPSGPSKQIRIEPRPISGQRNSDLGASSAIASSEAARAERAERERQEALEQEAAAAERAKRCDNARRMNAEFGFDGRKCSYSAEGVRTCLTSAEIDAKRVEAARLMAEFCGAQR